MSKIIVRYIHEVKQVGMPYSEKRHWAEGVDYNFRGGIHEFRAFLRTPHPAEVMNYRSGDARFALAIKGDAIFLCYKFGILDWCDTTFSIHLVPKDERTLPAIVTREEPLFIILTDAENGIVRVSRKVWFPPEFASQLNRAINEQYLRPFPGEEAYVTNIENNVFCHYTSAELAITGSLARCKARND